MSFGKYGLLVAGILIASLPVLFAALAGAGEDARRAALLGALLAALNTLVAYGLVVWSAGRSTGVFMRAILGGMVGRMAVLLAAVVAAVSIPVIGGFGGGPWLDGRVRLAHAAIGYAASFLEREVTYANVAKTAFEALTALADDVRSARQIRY